MDQPFPLFSNPHPWKPLPWKAHFLCGLPKLLTCIKIIHLEHLSHSSSWVIILGNLSNKTFYCYIFFTGHICIILSHFIAKWVHCQCCKLDHENLWTSFMNRHTEDPVSLWIIINLSKAHNGLLRCESAWNFWWIFMKQHFLDKWVSPVLFWDRPPSPPPWNFFSPSFLKIFS